MSDPFPEIKSSKSLVAKYVTEPVWNKLKAVVTSLPDLTLLSGESIREYLAEEWAVKWSQEKSQTYEFSADQMKVVRPEKVRNNP